MIRKKRTKNSISKIYIYKPYLEIYYYRLKFCSNCIPYIILCLPSLIITLNKRVVLPLANQISNCLMMTILARVLSLLNIPKEAKTGGFQDKNIANIHYWNQKNNSRYMDELVFKILECQML